MKNTLDCFFNIEIYASEGGILQITIVTLLEPFLDQNYKVYQDNC